MRSVAQVQKDFLDDLNKWQNIIHQYGLADLQKQPGPNQWSIGQIIDHFIIETNLYIEQAKKALTDTENYQESKSNTIAKWFAANSFPDERFKGPEGMDEPDQPKSIDELNDKIEMLKKNIVRRYRVSNDMNSSICIRRLVFSNH